MFRKEFEQDKPFRAEDCKVRIERGECFALVTITNPHGRTCVTTLHKDVSRDDPVFERLKRSFSHNYQGD